MVGRQAFRFGIRPIFGDYVLYLVTSWWISQTLGAKPHSLRYHIGLVNYPPLKKKIDAWKTMNFPFGAKGRPIFRGCNLAALVSGRGDTPTTIEFTIRMTPYITWLRIRTTKDRLISAELGCPFTIPIYIYMRNLIEVCSGSFLYF